MAWLECNCCRAHEDAGTGEMTQSSRQEPSRVPWSCTAFAGLPDQQLFSSGHRCSPLRSNRLPKNCICSARYDPQTFEQPWPASIGDAGVVLKRPRVTIASRPPNRRAILNENEIVSHLTNNWDVNVTVTNFRMSLASAIALMQETDVLLGMHGAGAIT